MAETMNKKNTLIAIILCISIFLFTSCENQKSVNQSIYAGTPSVKEYPFKSFVGGWAVVFRDYRIESGRVVFYGVLYENGQYDDVVIISNDTTTYIQTR